MIDDGAAAAGAWRGLPCDGHSAAALTEEHRSRTRTVAARRRGPVGFSRTHLSRVVWGDVDLADGWTLGCRRQPNRDFCDAIQFGRARLLDERKLRAKIRSLTRNGVIPTPFPCTYNLHAAAFARVSLVACQPFVPLLWSSSSAFRCQAARSDLPLGYDHETRS